MVKDTSVPAKPPTQIMQLAAVPTECLNKGFCCNTDKMAPAKEPATPAFTKLLDKQVRSGDTELRHRTCCQKFGLQPTLPALHSRAVCVPPSHMALISDVGSGQPHGVQITGSRYDITT